MGDGRAMSRVPSWAWLVVALLVIVLAVATLASMGPTSVPTASGTSTPASATPAGWSVEPSAPTPTPGASPSGPGSDLAALVASLAIAAEHRAGYGRDRFEHWIDADGDGCDTRREVLIAEAVVAPTVEEACWLTGGSWFSSYDGLTLTELARIDVDHVVALAEAWDSGAWAWTDERRRDFANDLGVDWALIAVSASSNRTKSDRDPADWLPERAEAVCPFLAAWVSVKVRWGLTVDRTEARAIARRIMVCSDPVPSVAPLP